MTIVTIILISIIPAYIGYVIGGYNSGNKEMRRIRWLIKKHQETEKSPSALENMAKSVDKGGRAFVGINGKVYCLVNTETDEETGECKPII